MNPSLFERLWKAHPYPNFPCDQGLFPNQCAIRLGVAFDTAGIVITKGVRRCANNYTKLREHSPGHILSAQELATALDKKSTLLYPKATNIKFKGSIQSNISKLSGKKGIIFIMNGWGTMDHIDLWDGWSLKGGDSTYLTKGEQIWFWRIA